MFNFLKLFLGNKSHRDIKAIMPIVENVKKAYETIKNLSNDELRAKTLEFKAYIASKVEEEETLITQLREKVDNELDMEIEEKDSIYKQIDSLQKTSYKKMQEALDEILPEAFSVIKETARRFKENETVRVTATAHDGDLAAKRNNITIEGNTAIYQNKWMAGGNLITWDMVHYDVQLIGGIVLHSGKISEMATGEVKSMV